MNVRPGMVGLSGGKTFMQRAIRFFIGSKFSHSFSTIMVGPEVSALETTETRITVTPLIRKKSEKNWVEIWDVIAADTAILDAIFETYSVYSGQYYGYLSYIWFIYRWIVRHFGIEPTKMWEWCNKGITCTELTCSYLSKLFPDLFLNDINTYSPKELRKIMLENPDRFRLLGWYINEQSILFK